MATVTIDPTVPPNSENPQNGAFRIREVAAWLLDILGLNATIPNTVTIPPAPQIDTSTGLFFIRAVPMAQALFVSPDAITPTTTLDVTANFIQTLNPSTSNSMFVSNFSANCVVVGAQAGSAANGRDQAAAFGNSTFYHLYIITGSGVSPATIVSLTAPLGSPTFPAGYTNWYYAGTYRTDGSGNVMAQYGRGSTIYYGSSQQVLASGSATTATAISTSSFVPSLAQSIQTYFHSTVSAVGSPDPIVEIGLTSTTTTAATSFYEIKPAAGSGGGASGWTQIPNISQQFFYKWTLNSATGPALDVEILGYTVGNGAT